MTRRISHIALAAALFLGGVSAHAQTGDMTIVPGERVGTVSLGMNEMQLIAAAGPPNQRLTQGGDNFYSWGLITARIGASSGAVDEIAVNDPRYLTSGRIHVGSTDLAVTANFGQPTKRTNASGLITLDFDGISIVQRANMVMQVRVHK